MLTLTDSDGCLYSFPLNTLMTECEGYSWYFIRVNFEIKNDIIHRSCVNLSYTNAAQGIFVSISGKAEIIRDINKMNAMWKPVFAEWFPLGLKDPELILLKVNLKGAKYWDVYKGEMKNLWDDSEATLIERQNENIDPYLFIINPD